MFSAALNALSTVFTPSTLVWILIGSLLGLSLGMIPGLGGVVGMSILLPFVYGMTPANGIALLIGMVTVSATAEAFPAVLLGVPGTAAAAATILDGYPLARQGKAARALGASFFSSMVGGLIGAVFMFGIISAVRPIIFAFGSPELFMLTLLGLSMVGTLSKGKPIAGLAAGLIGMALGTVGTAPELPQARFTFGSNYLSEGIQITVVAIGLFAIPELIELLSERRSISSVTAVEGGRFDGVRDALQHKWLIIRSSIAGCFLGLVPGVGGTVIDWIVYGLTVRTSRHRERFGKGDIRGVIGPDSANNSREGGNLVPTLLFGIPGGASMAVLLGGLLLLGIQVGPTMVSSKLNVTLGIAWTMAVANVVGTALCFLVSKRVAKVANVEPRRLAPILLVVLIVAAYQATFAFTDISLMLGFGIVGYMMKRTGWPRPPVLIGFVLAPSAEQYLHLSISLYGWSWITRPGVIIAALIIAALSTGVVVWFRSRKDSVDELPTGAGIILSSGTVLPAELQKQIKGIVSHPAGSSSLKLPVGGANTSVVVDAPSSSASTGPPELPGTESFTSLQVSDSTFGTPNPTKSATAGARDRQRGSATSVRRSWTTFGFSFLVVLFFAAVTKLSLDFQPLAREFPLAIGVVGLLFSLVNLIGDAVTLVRARRISARSTSATTEPPESSVGSQALLGPSPDTATLESSLTPGGEAKPSLDQAEDTDDRVVGRRGLYYWGWIAGLGILVWLVGFVLGSTIFLVAFLKIEGKLRWLGILLVVIAFIAFEYAGSRLIGINLPPGQFPYLGQQINDLIYRVL